MPSPEMRELIGELRRRHPAPTLAQARATFTPSVRHHPVPADVRVTAAVPGYWLDPPGADPHRVLLYIHGGGYTNGSLHSHGELAARLGRAAGMRVLFSEYRLAPEHPYPAALDDVRAGWRWLRHDQGLPAATVALAGDSAGAALAVALLTTLRDAGADQPAAAALLSPHVDLTATGPSVTTHAADDVTLTPDALHGIATAYLAGTDPRTPLASPLFADLSGLPPLLILAGTAEILLSDAQRLAARAAAAGVDVTLREAAGLPHAYPIMLGTPEAAEATTQIGTFLRAH